MIKIININVIINIQVYRYTDIRIYGYTDILYTTINNNYRTL